MTSLDQMHTQAAIQDSLLQSYRRLMFSTQPILLAVGALLCTAVTFCASIHNQILIFSVFITLFILALCIGVMLRKVIQSRQKDVDYWQNTILASEEVLFYDQRILTAFKIHQKMKRKELMKDELFQKMDDKNLINSLIQKDKGHTRTVIDSFLPFCFFAAWLILFFITMTGSILTYL